MQEEISSVESDKANSLTVQIKILRLKLKRAGNLLLSKLYLYFQQTDRNLIGNDEI